MDKQQLESSLATLHQELSQVENVDPSTRELLVTLMQDIAQVLTSDARAEEGEEVPTHRSDNLRNMVTEFEAEHPQLARTIGQIADGLASIGI